MFFLVAGLGGAVGLFIVSKGMLMKSAGRSMRILIGDEGMKRAESVKTDAKAAKKAGMESPTQRQERLNRERKKEQKKERSPVEEAPKKASSGDALGGFDLDSVLASTSSSSSRPGGGAPPGRKSSVVEATNSDIIVQNITYNIQDSAVAGDISPPKPPVRRRKAVKKAPSEPVEEEAPPVRQFEDEEEEEFSDFSF